MQNIECDIYGVLSNIQENMRYTLYNMAYKGYELTNAETKVKVIMHINTTIQIPIYTAIGVDIAFQINDNLNKSLECGI